MFHFNVKVVTSVKNTCIPYKQLKEKKQKEEREKGYKERKKKQSLKQQKKKRIIKHKNVPTHVRYNCHTKY